jgi:threonine synthase
VTGRPIQLVPSVQLACRACGERTPPDATRWRCNCGGLFDLEGPAFDGIVEADRQSLWRYGRALPFREPGTVERLLGLGEGLTSIVEEDIDGTAVHVKLEYASPTGSFKDRGAVTLVAAAVAVGATEIVVDSSGNAGTAISAYAARAGLRCSVFVPGGTSPKKLRQMGAHGAEVVEVPASREDTAAAAIKAVTDRAAFYASHVYSPFFFEGTKTYGLEVWEQLGTPDWLVLPVGNGTLVLGVALAYRELLAAGLAARLPRLLLVQAERSAPIADAFTTGSDHVAPVSNDGTIAEGIAIGAPARGDQLLEIVRAHGGTVVAVSEEAIANAAWRLAGRGLYVEPTAAAPLAGLLDALAGGVVERAASVVVPLSGSGLKAP